MSLWWVLASTCFFFFFCLPPKGAEEVLPAVELHFDYISRDKRRRRYVLLDDDPPQALQVGDASSHARWLPLASGPL